MKEHTFNALWTECIEKAGIELLNVFSPEKRESFNWKYDFSKNKQKEVFARYKASHDKFRERYFYGHQDPRKLIDIHKIGSCFSKAIIDSAIFSFRPDEGIPWIIACSNYALAYNASINIVSFFLQAYYERTSREYYNDFLEQKIILYPTTTIGHDTYTIGRIKALALADINGEEFDYLGYADMLFWIEHYNRQIIEKTFVIKPFVPRDYMGK